MRHSEYVEIAKGFGEESLKKALVGVAVKSLPFFISGPFNIILIKLADFIAKEVIRQAEFAIFFSYIDFRTDLQAKDFEAAMIKNHKAQLGGTNEEKIIAEKELSEALNRLVSIKS